MYDVVLVIGAEKMTDRVKGGVTPDPSDLDAMQGFVMTAGHALSARRYMVDHGATREEIAMVAVKNHNHSRHNPFAHYQRAVALEEVLAARLVADPLGVLDCSPMGLGLIPRGEGARWTASGRTSLGGELPVNPSGGLLSRGHPVGATGMAQLCELYWQLTDQAGKRQVNNAKLALSYCKGGTVSGTDGASVTAVVVSR